MAQCGMETDNKLFNTVLTYLFEVMIWKAISFDFLNKLFSQEDDIFDEETNEAVGVETIDFDDENLVNILDNFICCFLEETIALPDYKCVPYIIVNFDSLSLVLKYMHIKTWIMPLKHSSHYISMIF